jgi:transposase InsO family protein
VKFAWIKDHRRAFPVEAMCRVLGVSKAGFYASLVRPPSGRRKRREELAGKVRAVHEENRGVYGSPRVHRALAARGEKVCENTVAKVMKAQGISAKAKRKFVPRTTDGDHTFAAAPNVLGRDFAADVPDRKWAADITYVPTDEGWLYLAAVIDLCSRRIVGWSMAGHMRAELCTEALGMALAHRSPGVGLLHHSDRGVQYACEDYRHLLRSNGIVCSMSGKGDCYDNAVMESFWATLKTELVHHEHYATHEQARASIFEYVEVFYNRKRLHSALGYQSPETFEAGLN